MADEALTLWAIAVPRPNGKTGETHIPAASREHAEGMAARWSSPARVTEWPHSPESHARMAYALDRLFGERVSRG